ncbi:PXM16 [Scenedesmus sp. PABB004]|nr:PXM16 [Scenedesmus sp. PABB004]
MAEVVKPRCDRRAFAHAVLANGVRVLAISDVDAQHAAACANVQVGRPPRAARARPRRRRAARAAAPREPPRPRRAAQAGYFDDPPDLPGAAHFLEHVVHLGSAAFPDEREYKAFLAQHGGSSNASTSMVHTRYHFRVHASALPGALDRLGAALAAPLIAGESVAREVENVHAEFSRNTNSDSRKLLQLRRGLCAPPYSSFSTGNLDTLRTQPAARGADVPAALRALWARGYSSHHTCLALVGPQPCEQLLAWAGDAFGGMAGAGGAAGGAGAGGADAAPLSPRYPSDATDPDAGGALVLVRPQRELRELELTWYVPAGVMAHSACKPWAWAAHLLGHEGPGSVAHLLKAQVRPARAATGGGPTRGGGGAALRGSAAAHEPAARARAQGLVQSLEAGMGDEVRLGRGWMFWRVRVALTAVGEEDAAVQHVVASVLRGVAMLQRCSDAQLAQTWHEAAELAALRFDWREAAEPLPAAQAAAYALHYYDPAAALSGPALMTRFDAPALRWFAAQLAPARMTAFWSSRRHARGPGWARERWYGAEHAVQPLPAAWLEAAERYAAADAGGGTEDQPAGAWAAAPGELRLPEPNWALPQDLELRAAPAGAGAAPGRPAASYDGATPPPQLLVQRPGLCAWHAPDASYGVPKVHLRLHAATPAVYSSPEAAVAARLLVRVLEDVLLPATYPAELAGSEYSLSVEQGGLTLKVTGFLGVAQRLLGMVLDGLADLTVAQVEERFGTMAGRLTQALTNWSNNNPSSHAEYAAHHLLQPRHHHNAQLLAAAAAATPAQLLALRAQLVGGAPLHVDLLAAGNISAAEAAEVAAGVQARLAPRGLPPGAWPPAGGVLSLGGAPALFAHLPANPNPANGNHALHYLVQLGGDDAAACALLDLFVQVSAKPCFHELRTRQRLGYSVALTSALLHRQLGLVLRVQSPATPPDALASAARAWLGGFRPELAAAAAGALLDAHKQALRDKYLEPPKTLAEAARRTWGPIAARHLDWARRRAKAAAVAALTAEDLLAFYDDVLHPDAPRHAALSVQLWGGAGGGEAAVDAAAAAGAAVVLPEQVAEFRADRGLLPAAEVVLPPAAPGAAALLYKQTAEKVLPPRSQSAFEDKRVLTPAEFVAAGDYLVRACPTWSWETGDPAKARSFFPIGKQFLVTRRVPCLSRAAELERYDPGSEFALAGDDDGWVATHQDPQADAAAAGAREELPDLDERDDAPSASHAGTRGDDEVPDISELELADPDDEAALPPGGAAADDDEAAAPPGAAIRRTRTYDLYITYDQYYQVPRFWLVGFDEAQQPLRPEQVLEDVSEEHARKTITLDPHPHLGVNAASIHPCRHAEVMKKLADNLAAGGQAFKLEQYLVLFLKFIASVVPTITYDYTMSVGGGE